MLATRFANETGCEVVHCGPPSKDPFHELLDLTYTHTAPVAFDRFHLGEQVYGPIYRGADALGGLNRRLLERRRLRQRYAVVVLCLPPYAVARANWERRKAEGGEMFPDDVGYRKVYDGFFTVKTELPVIMYDYTAGVPLDVVLDSITRARIARYTPRAI